MPQEKTYVPGETPEYLSKALRQFEQEQSRQFPGTKVREIKITFDHDPPAINRAALPQFIPLGGCVDRETTTNCVDHFGEYKV